MLSLHVALVHFLLKFLNWIWISWVNSPQHLADTAKGLFWYYTPTPNPAEDTDSKEACWEHSLQAHEEVMCLTRCEHHFLSHKLSVTNRRTWRSVSPGSHIWEPQLKTSRYTLLSTPSVSGAPTPLNFMLPPVYRCYLHVSSSERNKQKTQSCLCTLSSSVFSSGLNNKQRNKY